MGSEERIASACAKLCDILVRKNRRYGDAVGISSSPTHLFAPECEKDVTLTLRTRIDEKLNRLQACEPDEDEDVLLDLTGLLVLLLVQRGFASEQPTNHNGPPPLG